MLVFKVMKQRSTTPVSTSFAARAAIVAASILMMVATPIQIAPTAFADQFDDQIAAIQREVDQYQAAARDLSNRADTLQRELDRLSNEKAQLQSQINLSQAKYDQLVKNIAKARERIKQNRLVVGELIVNDSVADKVSPFVRLAGSDNLAKSLDEITNAEAAQDDIIAKIKEIEKLRKQLEDDRKALEVVLTDQKHQRDALVAKENEHANLVAQTRGEEAAYQQLSAQRNKDISKLRAAQIAANRQATGGIGSVQVQGNCGGGYPGLAQHSRGQYGCSLSLDGGVDKWGMYNRECVSYAAFKVAQSGRTMPDWGFTGPANAIQWLDRAAASGISYDRNPRVGDVAILPIGYYGHAMYVEQVSGGQVYLSEMNLNWDGNYTERWADASSMYYIHF